jgi:glycerol-3-phosphate acyltransferase PlsY
MEIINIIAVLALAFIAGSVPFGLIIVKLATGKDVRKIESGRTGGTNAMRAAGLFAGIMTALLDVLKGVASGWIVGLFMPESTWLRVFAALMVVLGHNYSIFLIEKGQDGKLHFKGGAGGAPTLGGAIALWPFSWWFILPASFLVYIGIGYASVTTISIAFFAMIIFVYRALMGQASWIYTIYGVIAIVMVIWALRPNLERLRRGTERAVGLRAYFQRKAFLKKPIR